MTQTFRLPVLAAPVARRVYGDVLAVRAGAECRRYEAAEYRTMIAIWATLVAGACYLFAAYAVGAVLLAAAVR